MTPAPNSVIRFRPLLPALTLLAALLLLLPAAGCARRFPSERIPQMKLLLAPFEQPPTMSTEPRAVRGWWFGETIYRQNTRAGEAMIDTLNRAFAKLDFVNLYSPIEIKYYYADKQQRLHKAYPYLAEPELKRLLNDVPPQEFARELGADKLLTGRILRQYMGENIWTNWWWARLDAEVYVMDVGTGQREWSKTYRLRRQFASDARLQEELALKVREDLKKEYFRPMAKK